MQGLQAEVQRKQSEMENVESTIGTFASALVKVSFSLYSN
jgi:DNA-binding protein YbaB